MKTIQEIKKDSDTKRNKLFSDCGVFWAFSTEQFKENKTPLKDGEKYTQLGGGGFLPNSNVNKLVKELKEIKKQEKQETKENKQKYNLIKYELSNYECYYTGNIEDALKVLPYTREEVLEVYNKERKTEAVLNNL